MLSTSLSCHGLVADMEAVLCCKEGSIAMLPKGKRSAGAGISGRQPGSNWCDLGQHVHTWHAATAVAS